MEKFIIEVNLFLVRFMVVIIMGGFFSVVGWTIHSFFFSIKAIRENLDYGSEYNNIGYVFFSALGNLSNWILDNTIGKLIDAMYHRNR